MSGLAEELRLVRADYIQHLNQFFASRIFIAEEIVIRAKRIQSQCPQTFGQAAAQQRPLVFAEADSGMLINEGAEQLEFPVRNVLGNSQRKYALRVGRAHPAALIVFPLSR